VQAKKAALFKQLLREVLRRKAEGARDGASMDLTAKLLGISPEVNTAWNFRREILEAQGALKLWEEQEPAPGSEAERLAETEMVVTEAALQRNMKSYLAWHHRQWVLQRARSHLPLPREFRLLDRLFLADERNFHAWGHRRFVSKLAGVSAEEELQHAESLIERNFSNYSAWHERARLLTKIHGAGDAPVPPDVLEGEVEMVKQAVFTEPDDQSPWVHLRWVMGEALAHARDGAQAQAGLSLLRDVAGMCRELLEMDEGSKWARLTLALALLAGAAADEDGPGAQGETEEARGCFLRLADIDPDRAGYYLEAAGMAPNDAVRVLARQSALGVAAEG